MSEATRCYYTPETVFSRDVVSLSGFNRNFISRCEAEHKGQLNAETVFLTDTLKKVIYM